MNSFADHALFLVAVMPNARDFEIARLLGWYRIPLRMAPKIVEVDYLAFYQTNKFGAAHRWMIEYFAPVRGHELTTRAALMKDEPHHPRAQEEYYKIQIGPIEKLSPAIPAGNWKRITFLYTLGELVNRAKVINDLVVKTEDRESLWNCLRERQAAYSNLTTDTQLRLFTDEELLHLFSHISSGNTDLDFDDV